MGFAFPKNRRLLEAVEFERVFDSNTVCTDRLFTVLMRPNGKHHARLGLAISKRRIKKAIVRNRIKRLVRESFRLHQHQLPAADIVVMAKSATVTANRSDLWESMAKHWQCLVVAADSC